MDVDSKMKKMKLELIRTYYPNGTNGEIFLEGNKVCSTIELPWKNNEAQVSCIPEGIYELKKRYSKKFGAHYLLLNVPKRSLILVHPANDAMKELKGCIAPVSFLTGEGKGANSRIALNRLKKLIDPLLAESKQIFLHITTRPL